MITLYRMGAQWTYRVNGSQELVLKIEEASVKNDRYYFILNGYMNGNVAQQQRMYIYNEEIYLYEANGMVIEPEQLFFRSKVKDNDFWTWEGRTGMNRIKMSSIVNGSKEITVLNKLVNVYHIETKVDMGVQGAMSINRHFSKELGVVKEETLLKMNNQEKKIVSELVVYK